MWTYFWSNFFLVSDWQIGRKLAHVYFNAHLHLTSAIFFSFSRSKSWNLANFLHSRAKKETKFIPILLFFSSSCHSFCFAISFTFLSASEILKVFCTQARNVHERAKWVRERAKKFKYISHLTWLCVTGCNRRKNSGEKVHHDYCQNVVKLQIFCGSLTVSFLASSLMVINRHLWHSLFANRFTASSTIGRCLIRQSGLFFTSFGRHYEWDFNLNHTIHQSSDLCVVRFTSVRVKKNDSLGILTSVNCTLLKTPHRHWYWYCHEMKFTANHLLNVMWRMLNVYRYSYGGIYDYPNKWIHRRPPNRTAGNSINCEITRDINNCDARTNKSKLMQ